MSEKDILETTKPTTTEKISGWFKTNIITIVVFLVCFLYLGRGFGYIDKTDKTILEILTDGVISLVFGLLFQTLLGEQGIINARKSAKYINTLIAYGKVIELDTPYVDKIDIFCDLENAKELKRKQTDILLKAGLKYNSFDKGEYDGGINPTSKKELDEKQLQAIEEARKVKTFKLTRDLLISEHSNSGGFENLSNGLNNFRGKQTTKNVVTKVLTAILFSYYTIKLFDEINYGAIIWYALQIVIFILLGTLQYFKNYEYVSEVDRSRFIRKTDLLYVFYNQVRNNPELFIIKEVEEDGDNEPKDVCITE